MTIRQSALFQTSGLAVGDTVHGGRRESPAFLAPRHQLHVDLTIRRRGSISAAGARRLLVKPGWDEPSAFIQ